MENKKENNSNIKEKKPWYKQGGYIGLILIVGTLIIAGLGNNQSNQVQSENKVSPTYNTQSYQPITPTVNTNDLSNDNYYTNTYGNEVHSPAYSENNSIPAGASARCGDGTYSFSQSRRGTCSHHGGVSEWL